jgi:predicted transposase YbfD/YdcC
VDEGTNEIPAVPELLKAFADLAGAVLTIDAMHTQHDTAQVILGRGADYVMTVKANMPITRASELSASLRSWRCGPWASPG